MKRLLVYIIAALVLATAQPYAASAMGIALNRQDTPSAMPVPQLEYTSIANRLVDRMLGLGIIIDTAVAKNRLFNFRVNIDCNSVMTQKDLVYANVSYSTNRLTVANTFGFGFIRTRFMRIWAGPQLALSYEFKNKNSTIFDSVIYNKMGAVVGLNLHAGEDMTFTFETGLRSGFGFDIRKSLASSLVHSKLEPIASFKLIFRSWDIFVPSRS